VSSEERSKNMPIESRAETKFNPTWKTMRELRYVKIGGEKRAKKKVNYYYILLEGLSSRPFCLAPSNYFF
jgi:hypothetical protein